MEKQASTLSTAKSSKTVDADLKRKLLNEYGHQSEDDTLYPLKKQLNLFIYYLRSVILFMPS
jgi:hypothetical protein